METEEKRIDPKEEAINNVLNSFVMKAREKFIEENKEDKHTLGRVMGFQFTKEAEEVVNSFTFANNLTSFDYISED